MYILYIKCGSEWELRARFCRSSDYATQVKEGIERKIQSDLLERRLSAAVMTDFVFGKHYYERIFGKTVLRALRHFDEVGISNDIYEALEEALDDGCEKFALVKEGECLSDFTAGEF